MGEVLTAYAPRMENHKRTEELYVTVPMLFRCPISMDVMKSPVSLCTGVTYDRSSIERWLALGNNTCPATMQTLLSTHTTPNLTLRRLIHLWLSQAEAAQSTPYKAAVSKMNVAEIINGELESESLRKVIDFVKASEENLKFIALSNDAVSRLVKFLAKSDEVRVCEQIVEILDLISPENCVRERLNVLILNGDGVRDALSAFAMVVRKGSIESKIKSAKILELIAVNPESQRKIVENSELLHELYNLCTIESGNTAVETALSALIAVATTRSAKKELIRLGIVGTAVKILSGSTFSISLRGIIERALSMLETIATCTEGRSAIIEDEDCVAEIVRSLMKCSAAATEHGVTVLWSVCCLARDRSAQEKVCQTNGLTKVLLVMQSDCSAGTKMMCGELVKLLRAKNNKSKLAPYETRTTHIMPY